MARTERVPDPPQAWADLWRPEFARRMVFVDDSRVIIGMTLLAISYWWVKVNRVTEKNFALLENSGLYWHLVDLIWIFVFPLFYLIL